MTTPILDEGVREFLLEAYSNLDNLEEDLLSLEHSDHPQELIGGIFRNIHTIKGGCGFFGLSTIERIAHLSESLLCIARDGELKLETEHITALLMCTDAFRAIMANLERAGIEGEETYPELTTILECLLNTARGGAEASAEETRNPETCGYEIWEDEAPSPAGDDPGYVIWDDGETSEDAPAEPAPDPAVSELAGSDPTPAARSDLPAPAPEAEDPVPSADPVVGPPEIAKGESAPPPKVEKPKRSRGGEQPAGDGGSIQNQFIQVNVAHLDRLMAMVGELVLARNQILQFAGKLDDRAYHTTSQRLDLITTELQEGVMKTRMQPIGNIWRKLPRMIRKITMESGKEVRLVMDGQGTELDKTLLEAIKDPFIHLVRNALDHGIESPERRIACGKDGVGVLSLRAYHKGGHVNIEIRDDGAGIDPERVLAKALERGMLSPADAEQMSHRDIINLIFAAGFSTAAQVTRISGRGVGMDVVRTNIEKIGGSVDIQTQLGVGTTFKLKIPLTLAIIPALIVTAGAQRFAIPQVSLQSLVRLEGREAMEALLDRPVYRLRGDLLPLVWLNKLLDLQPSDTQPKVLNVVILRSEGRQFGLIVDGIRDTEEIVVKPLGKQLKDLQVFSGATIMGDGQVALILDIPGIASRAQVSEVHSSGRTADRDTSLPVKSTSEETLLLVEIDGRGRMAIPLEMVDRLEDFQRSKVERSGGREVIQYRGRIMPLLRCSDLLNSSPSAPRDDDEIHVIVHKLNDEIVGLIVDEIVDIVTESVEIQSFNSGTGIRGIAIIQDHATELLDLATAIRMSDIATVLAQSAA